jgi:small subunit ribosomal protein S20
LEIATVANTPQARKRARQAENSRQNNIALRSNARTYVKKVLRAIQSGNLEAAKTALLSAVPIIDSMVNKKLYHRNKAARLKSRLNARVKALAA